MKKLIVLVGIAGWVGLLGACGGSEDPPRDGADQADGTRLEDGAEVPDGTEEIDAGPLTVRFSVSPLDFGVVPAGAIGVRDAVVLNTGATAVRLDRLVFAGHPGFSLTLDGRVFGITAQSASDGVALEPPLVVEAGRSVPVSMSYQATGPEAAQATVLLFPEGDARAIELKAYANLEGPCIKTNPARMSFGGTGVGASSEIALEVQSCGDVDLVLDDVRLIDGGQGVFSVDVGRVGTLPFVIPADSSIFVPVRYTPTAAAELGPDGRYVQDQATLRLTSNAYLHDLDVPLDGFGGDLDACPIAAISVAEGDEVVPGTVLHLSGAGSTATNGDVVVWEWQVEQPGGSVATFSPSPYVESPTFEVGVVGPHVFRLVVRDTLGIESCVVAEYTVLVVARAGVHLELTWRTPGDRDETDTGGDQIHFSAGSDLDLLLDPPPSGEPRDRDDTDGGGPESITFEPAPGTFDVLVHDVNDWGYGPSFATLRVYIEGVLRDEWADVELEHHDLWRAYTIVWPAGTVTRVGDDPAITHDVAPGF